MTGLLSNVHMAVEWGVQQAKGAKRGMRTEEHKCANPACTGEVASQFVVIRDGLPEVAFTAVDESLYEGFAVAARFFSAHIVVMVIDETVNGLSRMLIAAVDRRGKIEWREMPYDLSPFGLSWSVVQSVEQPAGLDPDVNKDMRAQMGEPSAQEVMDFMDTMVRRRPDVSLAKMRAVTDLATIQLVNDSPFDIMRSVDLFATEGSQRLAALQGSGIPVIVR